MPLVPALYEFIGKFVFLGEFSSMIFLTFSLHKFRGQTLKEDCIAALFLVIGKDCFLALLLRDILCLEATVIPIWKTSVCKRGILKHPVFNILNFRGWIKRIFNTVD